MTPIDGAPLRIINPVAGGINMTDRLDLFAKRRALLHANIAALAGGRMHSYELQGGQYVDTTRATLLAARNTLRSVERVLTRAGVRLGAR